MQLTSGQLILQYENGFLRRITAGKDEVLRMIYFAVRDEEWGTVQAEVFNERIKQEENCFTITYEMLFQQDDIKMLWKARIEGNEDNSISFTIDGKALTTFKKNRAGFCVLHPVKECSGKKVLIQHTDGSFEENIFPVYISPQQPFIDISAMEWQLSEECKIRIKFKGDIFETEDQRNWTDNSYKTYCTPLSLAFPVTMNAGDEVHQKITVKADGIFANQENQKLVEIKTEAGKLPIPKIGVGRAMERSENYNDALKALSAVGFSHYRVDIKLSRNNWEQALEESFKEAGFLKAKLEIALFLYPGCLDKVAAFIVALKNIPNVQQIILLEENAKCISNSLLNEILPALRTQLHGIAIGAGTDIYFTELNRSNLDAKVVDFVSYSVNPQVHGFDDATLIENTEGQSETVMSAKNKFDRPVHISPVTFKMRYNADAAKQKINETKPLADSRQQTFFGAIWTLLSVKELCEAGVGSVTYYETVGERGMMDKDSFQSYPLLEIFKFLDISSYSYFKKSTCLPDNIPCKSLIFGNDHVERTVICNHGNSAVQANFQAGKDRYSILIFLKNPDDENQMLTRQFSITFPLLVPAQSILFMDKLP